MKLSPVLASTILPASREEGRKYPHTFTVEGGLHYIQGNAAPYFSLTYTEHRRGFPNQGYSGGARHETILKHFPQFADLAALHLSDINGVPMHAEADGWYNLAGALGGFGEKYHGGNSKGHYPLPADRLDPAKPWQATEYRLPTRDDCLQAFARHCRITTEEARQIRNDVDPLNWSLRTNPQWSSAEQTNPHYPASCRGRWAAICEGMRPRWQREAEACISKYRLTRF